jgi:hypothetical protein
MSGFVAHVGAETRSFNCAEILQSCHIYKYWIRSFWSDFAPLDI